MALIEYSWRGRTWQFDEAEAPADAVPAAEPDEGCAQEEPCSPSEAEAPADAVAKAAVSKNKARQAKTKESAHE